jgi:hypothetical protein
VAIFVPIQSGADGDDGNDDGDGDSDLCTRSS